LEVDIHKLKINHIECLESQFADKSVLGFCFKNFKLQLFVHIGLEILEFCIAMGLATLLADAVTSRSTPHLESIIFVALIITFRFFLSLTSVANDLNIRGQLFNLFSSRFVHSDWSSMSKEKFDRLRAREFILFSEHITSAVEIIYAPVAVLAGLGYIFWKIGAGGFVAMLPIFALIPFSYFIAQASAKYSKIIFAKNELRLEEISRWIEWGASILLSTTLQVPHDE
jgi:hypothetical protein